MCSHINYVQFVVSGLKDAKWVLRGNKTGRTANTTDRKCVKHWFYAESHTEHYARTTIFFVIIVVSSSRRDLLGSDWRCDRLTHFASFSGAQIANGSEPRRPHAVLGEPTVAKHVRVKAQLQWRGNGLSQAERECVCVCVSNGLGWLELKCDSTGGPSSHDTACVRPLHFLINRSLTWKPTQTKWLLLIKPLHRCAPGRFLSPDGFTPAAVGSSSGMLTPFTKNKRSSCCLIPPRIWQWWTNEARLDVWTAAIVWHERGSCGDTRLYPPCDV